MIRIYSAANQFDAQLVCDALLDAGMDARVTGGFLTGAAGELPVDSLVSVWITEPMHTARARAIIDSIADARTIPVVQLPCSNCGEMVESNFAHCWACNAPVIEKL